MRAVFIGLFIVIALFVVGQGPFIAHASPQSINYVPLAPIDVPGSELTSPGFNEANSKCQAPTCFPRYLRTIYNVGIALAGLFAVVSIVRGGFELMFPHSILGRSEGKGIILRALGGLLIVYSSYILMNAINPGLARDLDLALQFPRVKKTPEVKPLTVEQMSEYQYGLLRDARVVNDAWRAGERTRLQNEIAALEAELARTPDDDAHLEERNIIQGNINIKKADLATLEREGVVRGVERDALVAIKPTVTQEELDKLIEDTMKADEGNVVKVHKAFDDMIAATNFTPDQVAIIRASEADRVASIHRLLAFGILDKPPKMPIRNPATGVTSLVTDGAALKVQIDTQVEAIAAARAHALVKLTELKEGLRQNPSPGLMTKIQEQESLVWNQSCLTIAHVRNRCLDERLACSQIPRTVREQCTANSSIGFD